MANSYLVCLVNKDVKYLSYNYVIFLVTQTMTVMFYEICFHD